MFFNTPARAKFLRAVSTELARIVEVVQAAALAQPGVRFRLEHDGRELLLAPRGSLRERLRAVFGAELAEGMLAVSGGSEPFTVQGYVSLPSQARAARSLQFLFVNGRPVGDRTLSHAALQACRPHFPRDRFAAYALFLEIPPAEVDVNVHPAKREVRFRTPGAVHALIQSALESALAAGRPILGLPTPPSLPGLGVSEAVEAYLREAPPAPAPRPAAGAATLPEAGPARRVVGQIAATFILVEEPDALLIADQHAAHERVLYDRLRQGRRAGAVPVQALLFPVTLELRPAAAARLEQLLDSLAALGFAVEPFGKEAFRVREVPAIAAQADLAGLLRDLAAQWEEAVPTAASDLEHGIAALAACHAAVRAGMHLGPARCRQVVDDLLDGGHALTCPHGRPAVVRYPLRDLARAFRRP